jgi:hypothetical protein
MRKFFPLLFIFVLINTSLLSEAWSQESFPGVTFVFRSSGDLKATLNTDQEKTIQFGITGLKDQAQADALIAEFVGFYDMVKAFVIYTEGKFDRELDAEMTLAPVMRTSHFTKMLISRGFMTIMVNGSPIFTADLNDQQY